MFPQMLNTYCLRSGAPPDQHPAGWLRTQLIEADHRVAVRTVYGWFESLWCRPDDKSRLKLAEVLDLSEREELLLYRAISAGCAAKMAS